MERIKTDILVIGAGSGGLSVAAGAAQMGARVVLLERGEMGGDCLNYGCVPSKALIAAAHHAQAMRDGAPYGVAAAEPQVDYAAAQDHVAQAIARIAPNDSQERFEGLGVRVIREEGRFLSETEVQAGDHVITARRIVLATGSSPFVPPVPGLDGVPYLTNETLWQLRERPEHLLIVGGGPIGLEMAQAHRRLGSRVTVIEAETALGREDPEMAAIVLERLRAEGVEILEQTAAREVRGSAGAIEVETADGAVHRGSHLLVAVGRRPNVDGLDLDKAGIETTKAGVTVDSALRTTNRRVLAVGDVAGQGQFTHLAGYHGGLIVRSTVLGLPVRTKPQIIPRATYTRPELAHVGLSEAEARAEYGDRLEVIREAYQHNDRAIAERQTAGLVKVMIHRGKPVGATIAGAQAGELIGTWALALSAGLKMSQIAGMVAPYPTLGELNKRVAGTYFTPRLFQNDMVKTAVRLVQRWLP
ncbi:dihydrolipoyl dehydrogenase family protein [Salipiger mucosus]|uniref:Mercuric ion reductase n=1 Tax=Salipiger mucosus DSM 16094 TaxID=1123237 RepID=S9R4S2_9RHOB|nr:FAD-dependent oxidoreductase [Salipiger mucosus]EPX86927.1 Mercuric ion reductase [Salipiger mucosus DSM 16094]